MIVHLSRATIPAAQMLTREGLAVSKSRLAKVVMLGKYSGWWQGCKCWFAHNARLGGETDARAVQIMFVGSRKHFSKGIVPSHRQFSAKALGKPGSLNVIEPAEDAVAQQATRAQQGRIYVSGGAVDRTDDLQTEEIGQHAVREVQDCVDLFTVVRATGHQRGV